MSEIHFDITANGDHLVNEFNRVRQAVRQSVEYIEKEAGSLDKAFESAKILEGLKATIDLSNPKAELEKFDQQVQSLTSNLDNYFDGLQGKLKDLASVVSSSPSVTGNADNAQQLADLQRQNAELIEQIRQRQAELEKERATYKQLADAVRTNNIPALQQLAQQEDEASKRLRLDEARNSLKAVSQDMADLAKRMADTAGDVERLEAELIDLRDLQAGNDPTATDAKIAETEKALESERAKLEEMKGEYNEMAGLQKQYAEQVQQSEGHHIRIRTQIMNAREELMKMIDAGQRGTPEFQQVAEQAAKMRREMALANATMNYLADPNKNLHTLKTGLQGVAGAAGLVTGVMGIFNEDSRKMAEIQAKVASIMSVIIGLETTYNLVKKSSNVMLAIEEVRTWAVAKARGVQAAATGAATVAQEGLNTAMKANPIGAIISLLAILGTAIYAVVRAMTSETDAEKKAREEKEAHIKAIREQHEQWAKSVADSASKQLVSYNELQRKWNDLGDDMKAKEQFIKDNQTAFHNLGFAINDVTDAENLLVRNTDAVVNAIMARARAAAYQERMTEILKEQIREQLKRDTQTGDYRYNYKAGDAVLSREQLNQLYGEHSGRNLIANTDFVWSEGVQRLTESGVKKMKALEDKRVKDAQDAKNKRIAIHQEEFKKTEELLKADIEQQKRAAENAGLSLYKGKDHTKEDADATRKTEEQAEKRLEAEQKMAELLDKQKRDQARKAEDLEFSTREAEIKAMKEGTDKTLRQLELDRDRELAAIRRSYEDMRIARVEEAKKLWEADTKNKGKNFYNSNQYKNASAYTKEEKDNRLAREMAVNVNYANEEQRRIEQLIASHQSYVDKKLAIDKKYEEDVAKIDAAIAAAEEKGQTEVVDALKRTRAEAEKDRAKSQSDLSLQQLKEMPEYIRAFEDLDNTSTETLEHLIDMFEKAKGAAAENMSPDELREYTNTIQQMQDEINGRDPFKALVDSSKKVKKADQDLARAQQNLWRVRHGMAPVIGTETKANGELVEVLMTEEQAEEEVRKEKDKLKKAQKGENKAWAEVRSEIDEVASSIGNLGSAIGGEAGQILQIASSVITFTTQTIDTVKQITESISNVKKGVEATMDALQSSNAILAIIGAAYSIFQSISSLFGESEEEKQARLKREEMMRNMTSSVEQYRLAVIKARQEEEAWFASSAIRGLAQQWELSSEAQKSYYAIAKQQTEQLTKDIEHWQNGNAAFGPVWAERAKFFQDYTASIKNAGNAFDMLIKNERDELETLSSFIQRVYGTEMFDAYGNLNTTVIESFLADYADRIQHDDEQILKNLNEMAKQYQEWQKALQEYVDEQYGGLSDDIVDALWSWYDEGTDVLDAFRDNARETFRGVASDIMKELVNSLVFDSLKEKLTGLFTAYSENVNKYGMDVADALKLLAEGTEAALTEFEGTVSQELPTLTTLMTQIGEMSDRLFGDGKEEATEYFDDIRSAWVDAVTGMKGDTADFGKEIARIMFENLVNSNIFNKEFDEWLKNWSKQYEDALKTGNEELKRDLEQQKSDKIKELTERTKEYADMTGYAAESNEELVTSLSNLRDTIIDSLLSLEDDASDIGKKVGSNLIREMLQQMLDSETYAGRMAEIKEHWQKALNGEDGYSYESVLKEIAALNNDIANDEAIGALAEQWKQLNANVEESDSVFKNLRSTFLDTLNDMEADAESFRKKLEQTMVRDVIDRQVLGRAFSFNGIDYTDLDDFVAKWNERYTKALESGNQEAIDALLDELVQVRELTVEAATELRDRLKEADEVIEDTTFKGMKDSFVSALMDMDASADDYGRTIGETLVRKIVEQFLSAKYVMPALEGLQSAFDEAMSQEGATYESVIAALSPQIEAAKGQLAEGQQIVRGIMDGLGLISGEVVEEAKEGFSDLTSAFKDALTSTEYDVATFGEQIGRTMKGQMLKAYIDREYSEQIEKANREWAEALESGDPERIEAIRQSVVALYDTIGSDDSVRSLAESLREVVEESVPENPFEELHSSFVSSLMDMEADAESFASDISRMLTEQMIEKTITDGFQEQIEDLGRRWALALETNDTAAIEAITRRLTELRDEMGKAVEPLLESIREVNVQTDSTFTSMTDSWISALMNMEGTAEQFAENVGKTMAQRIITQMVAPIYIQPVLDRLQDAFDTAISLEGATIQSVIRTLSPFIDEIEDVYNQILPIRDEIYTGFNIYHETVEEAVEEVRYALNDMKSNFVSSLMDMSSSADDFSKDISTILAQNFIENFVLGEKFNQQMEYWQSQYENIISSGMSENERKRQLTKLRDTIAAAKKGYVEEARAIQELLGLGVGNEDKKANVTIADKVTYNQMDEFTGILRAIQIAGEQRNDLIRDIRTQMGLNTLVGATGDNAMANAILTTLTTMGQATSSSGGGEVKEIRNMMIYTNQYLMDIQKSNKAIYNDFGDRLRSIDEKLSDLA